MHCNRHIRANACISARGALRVCHLGPSERLDFWKAIAVYLRRDESTVRRWEKEGLSMSGPRPAPDVLRFGIHELIWRY